MSVTEPAGPDEHDGRDDLINILVAQALDDLDNRRFDVATALRTVACLAWLGAARSRHRRPAPRACHPHERGEG